MNHSLTAAVATGLLAAAAGIAIAGLPSDPPGAGLRIVDTPATTTTTTTAPLVAPAPTTTLNIAEDAPAVVDTTAPTSGTAPLSSAPESTAPSDSAAPDITTPADTAPDITAPADTTPIEPTGETDLTARDELIVVAVNAGSRAGIATDTATILRAIGYVLAVPLDADENSDASDVYYRVGLEAEAVRLAEDLGWSKGDIAPLDRAPAFTTQLDVDLVVVLGQDSR